MHPILIQLIIILPWFSYIIFALPDIKPVRDSLLKKNITLNIRALFHNATTREILNSFQSRRSSSTFTNRNEKLNEFYTTLKAHSDETQNKTIETLEKLLKSRDPQTNIASLDQMWIINQLFIWNADIEIVDLLGTLNDVASIEEEKVYELKLPKGTKLPDKDNNSRTGPDYVSWGIDKIEVSNSLLGRNKGKGAVVGIIDTGVRGTHKALEGRFRSKFGWYDPYNRYLHRNKQQQPYDLNGHGTNVAGIAVGSLGLGVAPEAQWIACRGIHSGIGSMSVDKCMEWMVCPTDYQGIYRDCSKRPHVVVNSWNFPEPDIVKKELIESIKDHLDSWNINNIVAVFSNGDFGPNCNTTIFPATQDDVISVGAMTKEGDMFEKSSAGPVQNNGRVLIKPDVVAPGHDILTSSSTSDTDKELNSGTSIAAPYVAGLAALYFSQFPTGSVDIFSRALIKGVSTSAVRVRSSGKKCGGKEDFEYPNNYAGYGVVNARILSTELGIGRLNNDCVGFNEPCLSFLFIIFIIFTLTTLNQWFM